jgi:peptidase M23-like protein
MHQLLRSLILAMRRKHLGPLRIRIAISILFATALILALRTPTTHEMIQAIVIGPIARRPFVCMEHPQGQLHRLGDALGSDCLIPQLDAGPHGRFPRFYAGDGRRNEDWAGWNAAILAPFDGVVDSVHFNPVMNEPGTIGKARATVVVFRRADGVRVLYAHLQRVSVQQGDSVRSGEVVAHVGNNGPAWFPHTHIGAWMGQQPLQVRFDLEAMGKMSLTR